MVAAAVAPAGWTITEPCILDGMPAEVYHADPVPGGSLSSSGARKLLPPGCPARFRYGPETRTAAMETGTAAHTQVLGTGAAIVEIPELLAASNGAWSTSEAKQMVAAARAAGQVPVKPAEYRRITEMAAALRDHPRARDLLTPGSGRAEASVFWADAETGVWCRARLDWLPHGAPGRPLILSDYKTADRVDRRSIRKAIASYGYHMAGAWYREAVAQFRPGLDIRFALICQEKDPPYLVEVYEIHPDDLDEADYANAKARRMYRDCKQAGKWPGYNPDPDPIPVIRVPRWGHDQYYDDEMF
jgi:hypothetical protein